MHHARLTGVLSMLAAAALAACTAKESPNKTDTGAAAAATTTAAPAASANTVHVVAKDYTFEAPDSIPAGLTTLHLMLPSGREGWKATFRSRNGAGSKDPLIFISSENKKPATKSRVFLFHVALTKNPSERQSSVHQAPPVGASVPGLANSPEPM
jgi:hypothetical protein